ncbi:MAG: tRNA (adenosine(37)-N6)-threonylcarbamoyltransferase complex ATPase subunit type 1 TsaE [Treponema sp.]|nr:tRNA (adenosine(37)-N6)-threonylcarbamoyltransferase complex ATPase subunit type 1 TsaE [Treponema sp.]
MECCLTEHISVSPEETEALGERIACAVRSGTVIALKGGLGAGKTCLVKGIARGLGITEPVTSPTYTIVSEYTAHDSVPLYHIDAYRLNGDADFDNIGAGELIGGAGIAIIEWSERIPHSIPPDAITIEITITGPHSRLFRMYNEPACH